MFQGLSDGSALYQLHIYICTVDTVQIHPACLVNDTLPDILCSPGDAADTITNDEKVWHRKGSSRSLVLLTSLIFAIPLVEYFFIAPNATSEDRGQKMSRMEALDLGMALQPCHILETYLTFHPACLLLHHTSSMEHRP